MSEQRARHVFISYVRENSDHVMRLCKELKKYGVRVWLDRQEIKPGGFWRDAIRQAIADGAYFIACFSKEYLSRSRSYMNEELTLAIDELRQHPPSHPWFIPVLLSECDVPARSIGAGQTLLDIQWVPLYENWDEGIRRIISTVKPVRREIQEMIDALHTSDMQVRTDASNALRRLGDKESIPLLIEALKSDVPHIRRRAVHVLSGFRDSSCVTPLIGMLDDQHPGVRAEAASALGWTGNRNHLVIKALLKCLEDKTRDARGAAASALGRLGIASPSIIGALTKCSDDRSKEVRRSAARALTKLNEGKKAAKKRSRLSMEEEIRANANDYFGWLRKWEKADAEAQKKKVSRKQVKKAKAGRPQRTIRKT